MDYPLIDMDGHHCYEPDDAFTRYIDPKHKDRTVRVERNDRDRYGRIRIGDDRTFMSVMPGDHASALPDKPSEALREHLWVCPFLEDDVLDLIDVLGAGHVLFGSDWPHPEGLAAPKDFVGLLDGCDETTKRQVLRANGAEMLGIADAEPVLA